MTLRILVTGSRKWFDEQAIAAALADALATYTSIGEPILIHGVAPGADAMADHIWRSRFGLPVEEYRARDFPNPRARNQHMVDLGATVCLTFGLDWASGSGMCARMARRAGIPTIDYGVDTRLEARPR